MPDHRPAAGDRSAPIRTPDQLQQAKRPDGPAREMAAPAPRPAAPEAPPAGVLGQLATERAHD